MLLDIFNAAHRAYGVHSARQQTRARPCYFKPEMASTSCYNTAAQNRLGNNIDWRGTIEYRRNLIYVYLANQPRPTGCPVSKRPTTASIHVDLAAYVVNTSIERLMSGSRVHRQQSRVATVGFGERRWLVGSSFLHNRGDPRILCTCPLIMQSRLLTSKARPLEPRRRAGHETTRRSRASQCCGQAPSSRSADTRSGLKCRSSSGRRCAQSRRRICWGGTLDRQGHNMGAAHNDQSQCPLLLDLDVWCGCKSGGGGLLRL
jgi:hypothetical protein